MTPVNNCINSTNHNYFTKSIHFKGAYYVGRYSDPACSQVTYFLNKKNNVNDFSALLNHISFH